MAGIEKYYEITEVYAWQWEGNVNITKRIYLKK